MLSITPSVLDFGCVAQGFVYGMDAMVHNNDTRTQRIRVICTHTKGPELNEITATRINHPIAPGMSIPVRIELRAEISGTTAQYEITIIAEYNNLELKVPVHSIVVPMDIFKYFAKSLKLQNRPGTESNQSRGRKENR